VKLSRFFSRFFGGILSFLRKIANDLLVLSGISIVIWTNFHINSYFGWYSLGFALVAGGLLLTRLNHRKTAK
jgi:hypothetical protein